MVESARTATADDVARLVELAALMRAELLTVRGGEIWAINEARVADASTYDALLNDPDAIVVVGTIDDTVIGFATTEITVLRDGSRLASVGELFVEEDARAVGVGECMINLVIETARAADCARIEAFALPGHRAAKNFFEEQGMTARLIVMARGL